MAAEKENKSKTIERSYNIPLRREWLKAPRYKRTNKAVKAVRAFLEKHMKSEQVRLGMHLNEHLWKDGIRKPPHHVKVNVTKDEEGIVKAELEGFKFKEALKSKPKEEKPTGLKGKLQDVMGKKEEDAEEENPAEETTKEESEKKPAPKKEKTADEKNKDSKDSKVSETKKANAKETTSSKK